MHPNFSKSSSSIAAPHCSIDFHLQKQKKKRSQHRWNQKQIVNLRLIIKSDWPESVVRPLCKSQENSWFTKRDRKCLQAIKCTKLHGNIQCCIIPNCQPKRQTEQPSEYAKTSYKVQTEQTMHKGKLNCTNCKLKNA